MKLAERFRTAIIVAVCTVLVINLFGGLDAIKSGSASPSMLMNLFGVNAPTSRSADTKAVSHTKWVDVFKDMDPGSNIPNLYGFKERCDGSTLLYMASGYQEVSMSNVPKSDHCEQ